MPEPPSNPHTPRKAAAAEAKPQAESRAEPQTGRLAGSVVTRRGLEITTAQPGMIMGCLAPLIMLLGAVALVLLLVSRDAFVGGDAAWTRLFGEVFGWWWLALGGVATFLLVGFSRYSNDHIVLGRRQVLYQSRIGRVVVDEEVWPLRALSEVEVVPGDWGTWQVQWRNGRSYFRHQLGRTDRESAEALAERVRAWLAEPGALPVEKSAGVSAPLALMERALSLVGARLTMVLPLSLAALSLLTLALAWQHYDVARGRAEPAPSLDRVADGTLTHFAWHVHTPYESDNARVYLRLSIDYTAGDGVPRTLWLASRQAPELWRLTQGMLQRSTRLLGLPALDFHVPAWTDAVLREGTGWTAWRTPIAGSPSADRRSSHAASLLDQLDRPFDFLVAQWTAPPADWRVAYSSRSPGRAMPLRWVEAERAALRHVEPDLLAAIAAVAVLLLFATLPRLLTGPAHRWVGRTLTLGVVLAVPVWAPHAEHALRQVGVADGLLDIADIAVLAAVPPEMTDHAFLKRAPAPSAREAERVPVRWTPERSDAMPLLRRLGLDTPPAVLPLPDSAAAVEHMIGQARAALRRMSDDEAIAFIDWYDRAQWSSRASSLHAEVVEPAACALLDASRGAAVGVEIGRLTPGPRERLEALCAERAAADGGEEP
jgi:hypothetical protein